MFTVSDLKAKKLEAMKTKNEAMKNVVTLALGDLNTVLSGNKSGTILINGKEVSESKFLEMNIAKQLSSLEETLKVYEKRGDVENIQKATNEINFIKETYFPVLTTEQIVAECEKFKLENPSAKMKDWMDHLRTNFFSRYDGKQASATFKG